MAVGCYVVVFVYEQFPKIFESFFSASNGKKLGELHCVDSRSLHDTSDSVGALGWGSVLDGQNDAVLGYGPIGFGEVAEIDHLLEPIQEGDHPPEFAVSVLATLERNSSKLLANGDGAIT